MRRALNARLRAVPEWAVWLAGAIPLALLVADVLGGRAGVDPVAAIEHRLGQTALYFLIASLAVTPLAFLRGEARFDSIEALVAQMDADAAAARRIIAALAAEDPIAEMPMARALARLHLA